MASQPVISVIIPVWNGERYLRSTMAALEAQTVSREHFEIIVIDNGSTDRSAEILHNFPEARVLLEHQAGSYRARNLGVNHALGEYLLFTDADCRPRSDWVEQALALVRGGTVSGVTGGRITLYRECNGSQSAALFEELTSFNQEEYVAADRCVTANWLCSKFVLQEVGGFDAEMLSGGDFDCARRISEAGYDIRFAPQMIVEHPVRAEIRGLIAKRRRVVGGMWKLDGLREKGLMRTSFSLFRAGLRQLHLILSSDLPTANKPGVVIVSILVTASGMFEAVRLQLGARPYRS